MSKKNIEAIFHLSPAQQGMLLETISAPGSGIHIEQMLYTLRGVLDERAFDLARKELVNRQPSLRTGFIWKDQEEPLQFVARQVEATVEHQDWRGLDESAQQERLREYLDADSRLGFQLSKPPLLRLALFRLADDAYQLVWTHHHILMDGWSLSLLFKEFVELYGAYSTGQAINLPPARPYQNYISWLKRQDLARAEEFWRKSLQGIEGPTPLGEVGEAKELPEGEQRHGEERAYLSASTTASLQALARKYRLTMNTPVQAAWALLLSRYSARRDVVFGATVSGRPSGMPGVETTVGVFINTLPVRLTVSPEISLTSWLQEIQAFNLELRQFEYSPGGQVHGWSSVPGSLPLYESILVYENYPVDVSDLDSSSLAIGISNVQSKGARTKYALTFLIVGGPRLAIHLVYDKSRIDRADALRVLDHFVATLEAIAADPHQPVASLLERVPEDQTPRVSPAARPERQDARANYAPPRNSTEEMIAAIWSRILGTEITNVHANFFDLGGHSLLATQLTTMLSHAFQLQLPLRTVFESPTIASFAAEVARLKNKDAEEVGAASQLPVVVPVPSDRYEPFPLTDVQQAYWIGRSSDFELGNVATHVYMEIDSDSLDLRRFNLAWQKLIERHEMLRAIVRSDGQQQVLEQVPPFEIEVIDLRGGDATAVAYHLETLRQQMSHHVLPSDQWPLFEVRASVMDGGRVRLHIGYDMLISDAWSFRIISRELAHFYHDPEAPLPPLELSFRDYVLTEESLKDSALYRRSWDYWQGRVQTLPPAPDLPLAKSPASLKSPRFQRRRDSLEPQVWDRLKARAVEAGITPSGLLLAAFAEVLTAWSKSPRFTINLTLFNRLPLHPQVNDIVGDFTTLTLLEVDNLEPGTVEDRARRVQDQLWKDMDHRFVSAVRVMRELTRLQGGGARALMPVVFTSTLALNTASQAEGSELIPGEITFGSGQTPQVWLDCQVTEREGLLAFWWDAVEELFPEGLLQDMFEAYGVLLGRLADDEQAWKQAARNLTPARDLAQRAMVNATAAPVPDGLLQTRFIEQARRRPRSLAIISPFRSLTYDELLRRSNQIGRRLREMGARPNELVAVVMQKGWEQVVAALGALQSGAAYLPISSALPRERIWHLLKHAEARFVLTQPWLDENLEWPDNVERIIVGEQGLEGVDDGAIEPCQSPEDVAYVIYTSGSTGLPKGVVIDHRGAVNTIVDLNDRFGVSEKDRIVAVSSLSFDLSVYDIFGMLAAGGTIIVPEAAPAPEPSHWVELLSAHQVTIWNSVPALVEMTVGYLNGREEKLPESLRLFMLSGDWIPLSLPNQIKAQVPTATIMSLGGATEASIWSILYPVETVDPAWKSVPYGKPMVNQTFHVLDAELEPCPVWVPGQLFIGGIGLAKGYWRDEEKTDASFFIHPRTGERLYRTGDLGRYLPDGNIEFLGREDFQVKVQGFRIELGEIESALVQHPEINLAVVTAVGERHGNKRLVAYVVPNRAGRPAGADQSPDRREAQQSPASDLDTQAVLLDELRAFLREKLPDYMIPSAFVVLDSLPLTPNGKVDRKALPAPDYSELTQRESFVLPRTPVEEVLAGFWANVLGLDQVGVYDNFFELGGDSLIATQLISLLRKAFLIEIPIRVLFESPTVVSLAERIEKIQHGGAKLDEPSILPVSRDDDLPLSFAQQRLWFQDQLVPGNPAYNVPMALRLTGPLNIDVLARSVNEVIRRHEALRTNFETVEGQPLQVISPPPTLELPVMDLAVLPEEDREPAARAIASDEARRPFDLAEDRLLRVTLLRLGSDDHLLLLTMHHIVSDAWSLGVLSREVTALYEAFAAGKPSPLPDLPAQYADYAVWQREWLQGDILNTQLDYWREQLAGCPVLKLPTNRPRGQSLTFRSSSRSLIMSSELAEAVKQLSRREGSTLFMTLLAAFKTLLYSYTGQEDIVIGSSITGRNREEVEKLIGCFVNLLALRTDLSGGPTFRELLAKVREVTLGAYIHQDLPFDKLVEELQPERDLSSQTPLFRALFVLENAPIPPLQLGGLTLRPFEYDVEIARHDLNFHTMETSNGLRAVVHYNIDLFDDLSMMEMLRHYELILTKATAHPEITLNELAGMIRDEQNRRHSQKLKERKKSNLEDLRKTTRRAIT